MTTTTNTKTNTTLKLYSVHIFEPDCINRTEKELEKIAHYSNQPVVIVKINECWGGEILYTVIPAYAPTEAEFVVKPHELWNGKPMKLGRKNNFTLFSSDIDQFNEEDLRENYMESFEDEPDEEDLYQTAYDLISTYFEDFMSEINRYENIHGQSEYIVLADIGQWDGQYDGGKIIPGMENVIYQCIEDLDEYEIFFKNGQLHISGYHHDGSNSFVIRELKDETDDYIDRWECELEPRELHKNLFNSTRWSMRVKIFDILGYGGGIY